MKRLLTYLCIVVVTAAGAAAHGFVTNRWQPRGTASALTMPAIPETCGNWRSETIKSALNNDPVLRNLTRKYTHAPTGRVFTVSLTLGPAGLTAQHTPEYCYPGSGFKTIGQTQTFTAPNRSDESGGFRTAVYRKTALGSDALRILWAWSADGRWASPKVPELTYLKGSLYKLYVVSWDAERAPDQDAELQQFMDELLKQLNETLFQSGATPTS